MKHKLRKLFKSKIIIYSKHLEPAELLKRFESEGKKYLRVAFTNRIKFIGRMPITDIEFSNVTGIRKLPSPFKKSFFSFFGLKAKAKFYHFKK